MVKIRINELARELEVKAKAVIDYLISIGIEDKRSHSSSIEGDLIDQVKAHFLAGPRTVEEPPAAPEPPQPIVEPVAPAVAPVIAEAPKVVVAKEAPAEVKPAAAPVAAPVAAPAAAA